MVEQQPSDPYIASSPSDAAAFRALARHPLRRFTPDELLNLATTGSPRPDPSLIKTGLSLRTAERVAVEWVMTCNPEWRSGRFVTLNMPPEKADERWPASFTTRRRKLLSHHDLWTASVDRWAGKPTCQYWMVDRTRLNDPHLHLLLFGAEQVSDEVLRETWRAVNRIPKWRAGPSADVQPLTERRLFYCVIAAHAWDDWDVSETWPSCPKTIAPPDEEAVHDSLMRRRGRGRQPGRPVKELDEAVSWLRAQLSDGKPHRPADLRRAIPSSSFSWETLLKARRRLNIGYEKVGRYEWEWSGLTSSAGVKSDAMKELRVVA